MDLGENNKLIADFMGIEKEVTKYQYKNYNSSNEYYWDWDEGEILVEASGCPIENYEGEPISEYEELEYDSSWDKLMRVVDQIDQIFQTQPYEDYYIVMYYHSTELWKGGELLMTTEGDNRLECTYNMVIEIITFLNTQNNEGN